MNIDALNQAMKRYGEGGVMFCWHKWEHEIGTNDDGLWEVEYKTCQKCRAEKFVRVIKRPPSVSITLRTSYERLAHDK